MNVKAAIVANDREVFAANRAVGRIALTVGAEDGISRRVRVHEHGSLRVRFPNRDGGALDAMIVNTAGGMTGGDRVRYRYCGCRGRGADRDDGGGGKGLSFASGQTPRSV